MNKTVLVIDDDEVLRRGLGRGLRSAGYNVITAHSAEAASDILARIRVDAMVLDRRMEGRDGLTFLTELRATGDKTPVIMLTAMTGPENAIAGLSGGADDYLAKPFQLQELILRLKNITRGRGGADSRLPDGLVFTDDEFFVCDCTNPGAAPRMLTLSGEEKKLLQQLTSPIGNIAPATPMVAKRLRGKINVVSSGMDIITVRGRGYKLIVGRANAPQDRKTE